MAAALLSSGFFKVEGADFSLGKGTHLSLYEKESSGTLGSVLVMRMSSIPSDEEVGGLVRFHEGFVSPREKKGARFSYVYDLRDIDSPPSMDLMSKVADFHKGHRETYVRLLGCSCLLVSSPAVRTLINWVFTALFTPTRPVQLCCTDEDASLFLKGVASLPPSQPGAFDDRTGF